MAKRSYTKRSSQLEETPEVEEEEVEFLPLDVHEVVTLVLMKDIGTLNVYGPVTGKLYTWHGAGSMVEVDKKDVEGLLKRRNPHNCCSGSLQQPYFSILE